MSQRATWPNGLRQGAGHLSNDKHQGAIRRRLHAVISKRPHLVSRLVLPLDTHVTGRASHLDGDVSISKETAM